MLHKQFVDHPFIIEVLRGSATLLSEKKYIYR